MLKVGDSVKTISDCSGYRQFEKYIGTIHTIESISGDFYYLDGINDSILVAQNREERLGYWQQELVSVENNYKLDNNTIALIEAMGMQAENKIRELNGEALAYNEQSFIDLIKKYEKE